MGRNQCIGEAESMKSLGHGRAATNRRIHGSIYYEPESMNQRNNDTVLNETKDQ